MRRMMIAIAGVLLAVPLTAGAQNRSVSSAADPNKPSEGAAERQPSSAGAVANQPEGATTNQPSQGAAAQQAALPNDQVKVQNKKGLDASKSALDVPDRKFVERAASDAIGDIEISKLAHDRAQSQEVKSLSQKITDEQQRSLDRLKKIANDKQFPIPTSATTRATSEYQNLEKLSGSEFDRAYLECMAKRQSQASNAFEQASSKLTDPDLKSYASDTLPSLKQQKEQVQTNLGNLGR